MKQNLLDLFRQRPNAPISVTDVLFGGCILLVTLPYHRFFRFNTLQPLLEIRGHAARGIKRHADERKKLHSLLLGWRIRKKDELSFVSIAGTVVTAIVTASFSWPTIDNAYWVGPAFWYASLMTSVCSILLAAQQISLLALIGELPVEANACSAHQMRRQINQLLAEDPMRPRATADLESISSERMLEWKVSWKLIFTWQCPIMFIGYSTLMYFIGLVVIVCTPLIHREEWGPGIWIAITYLIVSGFSWGLFAYCSLGGYQQISLQDENDDEDNEEVETNNARDIIQRDKSCSAVLGSK